MDTVEVELLIDHPEALSSLTEWFEWEWKPYYGPDGPGDAAADLRESCNREKMPIAVVAIIDDQIVGTTAIEAESVTTHKRLTPWLAALLVRPEFRRRGIAERPIAGVEDRARKLGFDSIHVGIGEASDRPETPLRRRGWVFVEKRPYFVSDVTIFRKALPLARRSGGYSAAGFGDNSFVN